MKKRKIKSSPKGQGITLKSYHLYLDSDLVDIVEAQPNKTRFFNAAIRHFINTYKTKEQ